MAAPNFAVGPKPEKFWRKAVMRAVNERIANPDDGKPVKKLFLVARAVVDAAIAGDIAAAKEIGDRLDGKALQPIDSHVTIGADESFVSLIREISARRLAERHSPAIIDVRPEDPESEPMAVADRSAAAD